MRTLIPTAFFVPLLTALPLAAQDAADRAECALELAPRKFDMEGIRKAGLMYMPASLMLQAERPACVRKEPTYEGKPRYATLTLGNDAHSTRAIAVDEPEHGDAKVYLDLDGDGDLSDDGDGAWPTKAEREGASASYSGTFVFHVGWQAADGKASSGDYGVNFYYSPNFLNLGAHGEYLSGTAKYVFPAFASGLGMYVSGELGQQWLGTTDPFYGTATFPLGVKLKDYMTWNVGVGFTYKVFTLDLRYSDTNLSKGDCNAFTGDPGASGTSNVTAINPGGLGSRWCGAAFIAKLSADLTLDSLK